jgi:ADP-ribose pyrophosphatase YjhB (NUDIX family)
MEPREHFTHCPRCTSPRSEDQRPLNRFKCEVCGFSFFFNSASAVAAMVLDSERRLLFIRRAHEPGKGLLAMPGGFVDAGESAEEALLREVREEVGLELRDVTYFASYANLYLYDGVTYRTLDLFFMCRTEDPASVRALDSVSGVEWLDPQGVSEKHIAFESMRSAIRDYKRKI